MKFTFANFVNQHMQIPQCVKNVKSMNKIRNATGMCKELKATNIRRYINPMKNSRLENAKE